MEINKIILLTQEYYKLSKNLLYYANTGMPLPEYLQILSKELHNLTGCPLIELITVGKIVNYYWKSMHNVNESLNFYKTKKELFDNLNNEIFDFCIALLGDQKNIKGDCISCNNNFFTNTTNTVCNFTKDDRAVTINLSSDYNSVLGLNYKIDDNSYGIIILRHPDENYFSKDEITFYESIVPTFGITIANRRAQNALRERIKELSCLHSISNLMKREDYNRDEMIPEFIKIIPSSFQYPEYVNISIEIDYKKYLSDNFHSSDVFIKETILENGRNRGAIIINYKCPEKEENLVFFLDEEKSLLKSIVSQIVMVIEKERSQEEKYQLENQLRHADRLATIGQLAAGVAHELNEPLGSILGYAQLIKKNNTLDKQTKKDFEKIIKGSLHAREIIKKLMLFARQMPPKKNSLNINSIIKESIYFLEKRIADSKVIIRQDLSQSIPEIIADPSQLYQIMVNLIINAIQSMPDGGIIHIKTDTNNKMVSIKIKDTGSGISDDIKEKIFLPFFTTKDAHHGTGLGLPVVHGIITAHGGSINFKSKIGRGTEFIVKLPINSENGNNEN